MRKYEAIDLMKLHTLGSANGWNEFLTDCHQKLDINRLAKCRYQIQAGMDDLVKLGLNSETMITAFCRWDKSLVDTAKKIIRVRHPLPNDDPRVAKKHTNLLEVKRQRDREVEAFLKASSY